MYRIMLIWKIKNTPEKIIKILLSHEIDNSLYQIIANYGAPDIVIKSF